MERCELCSDTIPPTHRHLLDSDAQRLLCACRACSVLFDRREAGGGRYRLVPNRVRRIEGLQLEDGAGDARCGRLTAEALRANPDAGSVTPTKDAS